MMMGVNKIEEKKEKKKRERGGEYIEIMND